MLDSLKQKELKQEDKEKFCVGSRRVRWGEIFNSSS